MSKAVRPTFAALVGAAALAATAPASAERDTTHRAEHTSSANTASPPLASASASLRSIIEARAEMAERAGKYSDVDELATLWLTLERREQLDRVVARGDQFVNVSLRNQKRSEQRADGRAIRRSVADPAELELPTFSLDVAEALDAEAFVASLDEPYRSAIKWSLNGMNHREVAEQMGASHAAVRKWAQRLRDRLAEQGWELPAKG